MTNDADLGPTDVRALQEELAQNEALSRAVSHELRSPIGAMLIFSSLLEKEHGSRLDAQVRELLAHLTDCARNTVELMDRLPLFSRIRQQAMTPVRTCTPTRTACFTASPEPSGRPSAPHAG